MTRDQATELVPLRTGSLETPAPVPVWCALIRTDAGLVLFNTGLHPVHIARPWATFGTDGPKAVMSDDDALLKRLAAVGVRPEDVAMVVNSDLRFDHAGNNGAFPNATFVVQADHLAFARGKPAYPGMFWDIKSLRYLPVRGESVVAPGVRVLPVAGDVPGVQSLIVDLPSGRVVLDGDSLPL